MIKESRIFWISPWSGTIVQVKILLKILITAATLWITTLIFDDIVIDTDNPAAYAGTLLFVALVFGLVNAVVKPIVKFVLKASCLYYLSLGLLGLVLNALLFLLVIFVADQFGLPFNIDGEGFHRFWIALLASIVITVVSWVLNLVIPDKKDKNDR